MYTLSFSWEKSQDVYGFLAFVCCWVLIFVRGFCVVGVVFRGFFVVFYLFLGFLSGFFLTDILNPPL